jgi:hypothetical protein
VSEALTGVLLGGAIAIAGAFVNGWWSARAQRQREHEARVHAWRGDAYKDLLRILRDQRIRIEMTMPFLDEGQKPPEPLPLAEVDAAVAAVTAFGSVEVRAALEQLRQLNNKFYRAVQFYQEDKARGGLPGLSGDAARFSSIEDVRAEYRAKHDAIEELVATELQHLPR